MQNVEVRESRIEGKGVFACKDLKKGDYVLTIKGPLRHWLVKDKKTALHGPNWVGFGKNLWIDVLPPVVFLNHSCDPNIGIKGRVRMYALTNIKAGEEVTFDYATTESDPFWEMKCACGSTKCRHTIRSIQSLPKRTFMHYLPYVPTYFKKIYLRTVK